MKTTPFSLPQAILYSIRCLVCLGLICFIVLGTFFWLPANIHYHVTEQYVFSGGSENSQVFLAVMLPKSGSYQQIENVKVSWGGNHRVESHGFADVIKFYGKKSRHANSEAVIEYDVKLPQGFVSWEAPIEGFQQLPQTGIESDCDCIKQRALNLCEGIFVKDAYEVYSFTADYLTYSKDYQDCTSLSALQAYEIGSCVCAGYARLMTALCRASGIPAQMVLGLVYPDPMFNLGITSFPRNPDEAHAWVEYYAEDSWKMADPIST